MPAPKGRSKSAKKPTPLELAKEDAAQKQLTIESLTAELDQIRRSITVQRTEGDRLRKKLRIILPEVLAHRDRELFPLDPVDDVVDVDSTEVKKMLQQMISDLHDRQNCRSDIEERLEELENRITEQNNSFQMEKRKNITCMRGIEEALRASSAFEAKFIMRHLRHSLMLEEPVRVPSGNKKSRTFTLTELSSDDYPSDQLPPKNSPLPNQRTRELISMETSPLLHSTPRPVVKLSGDIKVKNLIPAIREGISTELSIEKSGRGDWRHFALLVGITTETVQFWRRLNLPKPMEQVLAFWRERPSSTIRNLHRVLLTEQMNSVQLASLVAQFYHVD